MKVSPQTRALLQMLRSGNMLVAGPGIRLTPLSGGQVMISLAPPDPGDGVEFDISYLGAYEEFEFPGP